MFYRKKWFLDDVMRIDFQSNGLGQAFLGRSCFHSLPADDQTHGKHH